jgi:cysteine-rich repeat protein
MRWVVVLALASCVSSNSQVCAFGVCPDGTVCDPVHPLCVTAEQLTACAGKTATDECTAGTLAGHCLDNVCLPTVCGDGVAEFGEMCDDGNTNGDDNCSADCLSDRTCGNGVIDVSKGEQCDDTNLIDHDGCSSTCLTETPHWIQHAVLAPKRDKTAIAYDAHRDRAVMFGGVDLNGAGLLDDTWEWSGGEWQQIPAASSPAPRAEHAMAYDEARGRVVVFGGDNGQGFFSDTWLWDGEVWTAVTGVDGPSGRALPTMAYDPKRKRVVLFGGSAPGSGVLGDTWEWDGAAWQLKTPAHSPSPRAGAVMAYDPVRGMLVMVGGTNRTMYFAETWTFDGTDWMNITPAGSVPNVSAGGIAWDVTTQRLLVFGGDTPAHQATLWAWNGTTWSTVAAAGPSARSGHAMTTGPARIVVFGGATATGPSNETWLLANNAWTQPKEPGTRAGLGMVNDPIRARGLVYGGELTNTPVYSGDTFDLSDTGFAQRASSPPTPRAQPCMAYDVAHHDVVMFGGKLAAGGPSAETWVWDGAGWAPRTPAMSPPARYDAACAFDGVHVTLFGGTNNGSTLLADAWTWDGTTWAPIATPITARYGAIAGYDPKRKQLVLFGGNSNPLASFDTWTYDGTTWMQRAQTSFVPPARYDGTLTWNAARQALVLVGGNGGVSSKLDAYEWNGSYWSVVPAAGTVTARWQHGAMAALDGGGVLVYGGLVANTANTSPPLGDRWELRWDAPGGNDRCAAFDGDGDGKLGCADGDCWATCTPACPPGTSCDQSEPRCGDGACDANRETCRNCPADCTCGAPVCGDFICDPGETCPGDCP